MTLYSELGFLYLSLILHHLQSIPITLGWHNVTSLAADLDIAAYYVLLRQKVALAVTAQLGASNSSAGTC